MSTPPHRRPMPAPDGWDPADVVAHGPHRAKVVRPPTPPDPDGAGRLILVTATTPTRSGEGKTVTAIGLADGLRQRGRRATLTLRQSSLGPTLGLKGGGAGGGAARLEPLDEALLGLGADLFAVESANNLLAAALDHELWSPDPSCHPDPERLWWRRVVDVDDRALRSVDVHPDGTPTGPSRPTGFDITAASEVMAVLSLATDPADLRVRLGRIVVGLDTDGAPITAEDLGAAGAMAALLRDAFHPNLLGSAEGTPALVHGGPFANIAHGCSSIVADHLALERSELVVTEAGFGADLGAEKFLHLKVGAGGGPAPAAVVLVTTVRALADHGARSGALGGLPEQVEHGLANLRRHLVNLQLFGPPVVVAVNHFADDPPGIVARIGSAALEWGAVAAVAHTAFTDGGAGADALAEAVERAAVLPHTLRPVVAAGTPIADAVDQIATSLYGAEGVDWSPTARDQLAVLADLGFDHLPICVAKTHLSLSHDPTLAGAPRGWTLPVRELRLRAGAGFVTVYAGDIVTMPGLPARPRYRDIDLAPDGTIIGLA